MTRQTRYFDGRVWLACDCRIAIDPVKDWDTCNVGDEFPCEDHGSQEIIRVSRAGRC